MQLDGIAIARTMESTVCSNASRHPSFKRKFYYVRPIIIYVRKFPTRTTKTCFLATDEIVWVKMQDVTLLMFVKLDVRKQCHDFCGRVAISCNSTIQRLKASVLIVLQSESSNYSVAKRI